jgi:hypothetical protein
VKTILEDLTYAYVLDIDSNGNLYFYENSIVKMLQDGYLEYYPSANTNDIITIKSSVYSCRGLSIATDGSIIYGSNTGAYGYINKIRNTGTSTIEVDTDYDGLWDGHDILR